MESCPLLEDGVAELATSAGSCSPATPAGPSTTTELQEMLENGVLWEAHGDRRIDGRCPPVCSGLLCVVTLATLLWKCP